MIDIGWCISGLGSGFSLKGDKLQPAGGGEIGTRAASAFVCSLCEHRLARIRDNGSSNRIAEGPWGNKRERMR